MKLKRNFFKRDVLIVAPQLLGCTLCKKFSDGSVERRMIVDVEAYGGEEDLASHARFGKTNRNKLMYGKAGIIYVYLVYGIHWLLNITTGGVGIPQAVLIRGVAGIKGPGRVGKWLGIDKSYYGEDITSSNRIWIEKGNSSNIKIKTAVRIGVDYAGMYAKKKWRFILDN